MTAEQATGAKASAADRSEPRGDQQTPWQVVVSRLVAEGGVNTQSGLRYGPEDRHRYDLFEPEHTSKAQPLNGTIQFIYGGSWETGARGCYQFVGAALAKRGYRVIIADYRLYPEVSFPGFVDDMARAYRHICETHLNGTDRSAPIVIGHSAGAHIGALLVGDPSYLIATAPGCPAPSKFVGMSGPYVFDPTTWNTTRHIFKTAADQPDKARPIAFAGNPFPPTLLLHGGRDTLVTPNATTKFGEALKAKGCDVRWIVYPQLAHAGPITTLARPLRWLAPTLRDIIRFVRSFPI